MSTKTREQKIKKLLALEEKRKRLLKRKPTYVPNAGQLPVHLSTKNEVWCLSANGSGKTTALVNEVHWAATGFNPVKNKRTKVPAKIIVLLDKSDKIDSVFLPEYEKWFELEEGQKQRRGKPYVSQLHYPNGSVVAFYSAESDPMSLEGFMCDYAFIDEPPQKLLVTAIRRSLRLKNSPSLLRFFGTPIAQSWIRTEVYEPWSKGLLPHVECLRMGIEVNREHLGEGYIERFASGLSESERKTRLEGAFFDGDALALSHLFKREEHILDAATFKYTPDMPCVVAIDNHSVKPHHAVMLTCTRDNKLIAIKEMAFRGNASQFAAALREWEEGYSIVDRVCDSLGNMETSSGEGMHSFIEGLRNAGVNVRPTTFKEKSHEDLVDRLRQGLTIPEEPDSNGLRVPRLRFLSTMTGLISDIESATWQKNRMTGELVPKLDTSSKDHLSCLGYALALHLFYDITRAGPIYRSRPSGINPRPEARRLEVLEARRNRIISRKLRR